MTGYQHQRILADTRRDDGHDAAGTPGDCWRTCIANLLELDPDDVPNFVERLSWMDAARLWLADYGLSVGQALDYGVWPTAAAFLADDTTRPSGVFVVIGPSRRGPWRHAVLMDHNLELVHDPHPDGSGIDVRTSRSCRSRASSAGGSGPDLPGSSSR
jgi:hypothetical protein